MIVLRRFHCSTFSFHFYKCLGIGVDRRALHSFLRLALWCFRANTKFLFPAPQVLLCLLISCPFSPFVPLHSTVNHLLGKTCRRGCFCKNETDGHKRSPSLAICGVLRLYSAVCIRLGRVLQWSDHQDQSDRRGTRTEGR